MNRALFWAPRALCMVFIGFVSLFALDALGQGRDFWETVTALTMHLIPSFFMVAALVIAWRWEWVGAVVFAVCALFFTTIVRGPWPVKSMFAVPCLVTAGLFLMNWRQKSARATPAR